MKFFILMVICAVIFSSCSMHKFVETDLYFGLSKPDGTIIDEKNWDNFVSTHIATVYTQGFTQINGEGKWLDINTKKLIRESSRIIISVHYSTKSISAAIDSITLIYKKTFAQQAVLRVDKKAEKVSF